MPRRRRIAPVCDSLKNSPRWIFSIPFRPSSSASDSVSVTEPSSLARHTFLDLSLYAPDLYHLVITTSQGITTKQIIKKQDADKQL